MKHDKQAFTLVELLVVVLIIAVLTSIALPMYQGAVDKSHWSTMLPAAKALKDAQEAVKMTNGEYTNEMDHLDVTMNDADLTFVLDTHSNGIDADVIRVTNSKLGDKVRLASYLDDSPLFAGQLHCEALKTDDRAKRLCGKLLQGQELNTLDGYTRYLLDQSIDKATCATASLVWSNKQTKCYKTEEDRCKANGMPYENGFCGYTNRRQAIVEEGATCIGTVVDGCWRAQIYAGGSCIANSFDGCWGATIHDGGKAICNVGGGCQQVTYEGTGCCEGVACPSAHKCAD